MDEVDRIIHHAHRGRSADDDLGLLVPAVEALRRGGLSYALDHLRVEAFDRAADAARRLGSDDLDRTLRSAAEIARGHRGFALDRATADFDRRHGPAALHRALRETVTAHRRTEPATSEPVPDG
ncbi:hypothetical protein [Virgisporangium aurantiacum]|uniref:Uncharacterized protein n=1 Tax=Virgisporangium aurantiacum TaxID=175570 RepID=A0A8J4DZN9_9ACTN|nr:hypothetical protein [Virgisporangium aurantiacum]GIJ54222.1 hypothetical protein Vau01_017380 [Virgisporangium aurantiacum]